MDNVSTLVSDIKIISRKRISITGLKKLVSFDVEEFIMDTYLGPLVLKGSNLEIVKLDLVAGDLEVKGHIDNIMYLDGKDNKKDSSFLTKLFKWL